MRYFNIRREISPWGFPLTYWVLRLMELIMPTKVTGKGKNRRVVVMPYRTSKKKKKK
jgi:hypothetical protein